MSKTSFKRKLIYLCLFMSSVSLVIGGVANYGFITFSKVSDEVTQRVIPRTSLLNTMDVNYQKTRIEVRTLGLDNLSKVDRMKAIEGALKSVGRYEKAATQLKTYINTPQEQAFYDDLHKQWSEFKKVGLRAI